MGENGISAREFGRIFLKYREKYIAIARSYVRDELAAEDIVSGCFVSFWENRKKIGPTESPHAYLLQSVKNRSVNWLRDNARRMKINEEQRQLTMSCINVMEKEELGPVFKAEIADIFRRLLERMPEMTRQIFCSSRFEDLTYEEIAAKYNVSPRKVKREIQTVLAMMRKSLKDYLPMLLMPILALFL